MSGQLGRPRRQYFTGITDRPRPAPVPRQNRAAHRRSTSCLVRKLKRVRATTVPHRSIRRLRRGRWRSCDQLRRVPAGSTYNFTGGEYQACGRAGGAFAGGAGGLNESGVRDRSRLAIQRLSLQRLRASWLRRLARAITCQTAGSTSLHGVPPGLSTGLVAPGEPLPQPGTDGPLTSYCTLTGFRHQLHAHRTPEPHHRADLAEALPAAGDYGLQENRRHQNDHSGGGRRPA